jgi:hypothetical protein
MKRNACSLYRADCKFFAPRRAPIVGITRAKHKIIRDKGAFDRQESRQQRARMPPAIFNALISRHFSLRMTAL